MLVFADRVRRAPPPALLLLTSTAIGCLGLALVLPALGAQESWAIAQTALAVNAIGVAMLLGAGSLCVSRWWIDRNAPAALLGAAALVYAVGSMSLGYLDSLVVGVGGQAIHDEISRGILLVVVLGLVAHALSPADIRTDPVVLLAGGLGCVVGCAALLAAAQRLAPATFDVSSDTQLVAQLALAVGWFGGALMSWRRVDQHPWAGLTGSLFLGFSLVRSLDAASPDQIGDPLHLAAVVLWTVSASVAAYCALVTLRDAVEADQEQLETVQRALSRATHGVAQRDAWREELSHDATNALAGLRAALTTLRAHGSGSGSDDSQRLYQAAIQEVAHLQHLVERSTKDQPVEFEVAEVIDSAVETRRASGLRIHVGSIEGRAVGRPGDLATVLQNLLVNAAQHAPGCRVDLTVSRFAGRVGIRVVDDGPGIPPALRERIFARGFGGPRSTSTGLGLFVARELMREQGGDLELLPTPSGSAFLISMAAGPEPAVVEEPVGLPDEVSTRLRELAVVGTRDRVG